MKKTYTLLLTTACILAFAGCENINLPNTDNATGTTDTVQADGTQVVPPTETATTSDGITTTELPAPEAPAADTGASTVPAPPAGQSAPPQTAAGSTAAGEMIGEQKAKEIGLAHARLKESDVTFIKSYLDFDDGRYLYDVEFYKDMTEYDYEIDAYTGDILSFDFDVEGYAIQAPAPAPTQPATQPSAGTGTSAAPAQPTQPAQTAPQQQTTPNTAAATDIGEAKARQIALSHAGLKDGDVTFIKSHPDYDDGRYVYDVEFYKDMTEYDYEIDAYTGNILSFDFDVEGYAIQAPAPAPTPAPAQPAQPAQPTQPAPQQQTNPGNGNITLDRAKSIALQRAGVSNATFTKAHLDYDDGIAVYEIDFIAGTMEYDVEVHAQTGAVLEFDAESIYDD